MQFHSKSKLLEKIETRKPQNKNYNANKQPKTNIILEVVYENERGINLYGKQTYSSNLLPTDPAKFTSQKNIPRVDLRYFRCPSGYEWVSDWMVDMNGIVDSKGFSYNTKFNDTNNWSKSVPSEVVIVRRRKWTRMRRAVGLTSPLPLANPIYDQVLLTMQHQRIDKERLHVLRGYIATVANEFLAKHAAEVVDIPDSAIYINPEIPVGLGLNLPHSNSSDALKIAIDPSISNLSTLNSPARPNYINDREASKSQKSPNPTLPTRTPNIQTISKSPIVLAASKSPNPQSPLNTLKIEPSSRTPNVQASPRSPELKSPRYRDSIIEPTNATIIGVSYFGGILAEFEFDKSKLDACLIIAPYISDPQCKLLRKCLKALIYGCDKLQFLQATKLKKEQYPLVFYN